MLLIENNFETKFDELEKNFSILMCESEFLDNWPMSSRGRPCPNEAVWLVRWMCCGKNHSLMCAGEYCGNKQFWEAEVTRCVSCGRLCYKFDFIPI